METNKLVRQRLTLATTIHFTVTPSHLFVRRIRVTRCTRPCATLSVAMCNVALGRVQHVSCFPDMRSKGAGMVLGPWEKGKWGHYDFNKVCNLASTVGLYSIGQAALIKQLFAMSFCIGSHFLGSGIGGYAFAIFAAELVVTS